MCIRDRLRVGGLHVLLAHLKRGSIKVCIGEWVAAGQQVAACGSSGRSPEPHLHLQVQRDDELGSPTRPFHLTNVLVRNVMHSREFRLFHLPGQDEEVSTALSDERLASAMRLSRDKILSYRLRGPDGDAVAATLRAKLTLLGQSRLETGRGASAAYVETSAVLGFYDRNARRDPMLDLWLLALGLTPLSAVSAPGRRPPPPRPPPPSAPDPTPPHPPHPPPPPPPHHPPRASGCAPRARAGPLAGRIWAPPQPSQPPRGGRPGPPRDRRAGLLP